MANQDKEVPWKYYSEERSDGPKTQIIKPQTKRTHASLFVDGFYGFGFGGKDGSRILVRCPFHNGMSVGLN